MCQSGTAPRSESPDYVSWRRRFRGHLRTQMEKQICLWQNRDDWQCLSVRVNVLVMF